MKLPRFLQPRARRAVNMAADHNIGSICLQTIASTWQVDDSAINWVENGFDWHPGSHLIRVRAHKHHEKERWRISVETDLLTSVPIEDVKFARRIAAFCSTATSTYSMPYPPVEIWKSFAEPVLKDDSPKLSLFSSIYVSPELLEWLPKFFAGEAICQVINAEFLSDSVSALAGGKPDHLPSGQNKNPDEIFQVLSTMFIPEGKRPSRWKGTKEFVEVAKKYGKSDVCFGMGEDFGLTLETPFGARSTLIQLGPMYNIRNSVLGC